MVGQGKTWGTCQTKYLGKTNSSLVYYLYWWSSYCFIRDTKAYHLNFSVRYGTYILNNATGAVYSLSEKYKLKLENI